MGSRQGPRDSHKLALADGFQTGQDAYKDAEEARGERAQGSAHDIVRREPAQVCCKGALRKTIIDLRKKGCGMYENKTVGVRRFSCLKEGACTHCETLASLGREVSETAIPPRRSPATPALPRASGQAEEAGIPVPRFSCRLNAVACHPAPWPSVTTPRSPQSGRAQESSSTRPA